MNRTPDTSVAERAYRLYEEKLKAILEPTRWGEFLVIDPLSGSYVLDRDLRKACEQSWEAFSVRVTEIMRIGFPSAVEVGYAH